MVSRMKIVNYGEIYTTSYECDIASLKVGNDDFWAYFSNELGDGRYEVTIDITMQDGRYHRGSHWEFVEVFQVKNKAYVYRYDCGNGGVDDIIAEIPKGRYGVYRDVNGGNMAVVYWDESL